MTFTPERSDAIRAELIAAIRPGAPSRRAIVGAGLVLAGVLLGVGGSAALAASGWLPVPASPAGEPTPALAEPIEAPPGQVPGVPIISVLGTPTGLPITAATELSLTDRPAEATHVRVTITCLTAGTFFWGTDPGGNNPSMSCGGSDSGSGTARFDFPLDASVTTLYITPEANGEAAVVVQYLTYRPTSFGINENGQTYGADGTGAGTPDLVRVSGTAPDGTEVEGYALATDLLGFSPDHPGEPANPEEAVRWQQEREQKYPNGWDIPIYESDGTTRVGSFHIG